MNFKIQVWYAVEIKEMPTWITISWGIKNRDLLREFTFLFLTSRGSAVRTRVLPLRLVQGFKRLEPFSILPFPTQFRHKRPSYRYFKAFQKHICSVFWQLFRQSYSTFKVTFKFCFLNPSVINCFIISTSSSKHKMESYICANFTPSTFNAR